MVEQTKKTILLVVAAAVVVVILLAAAYFLIGDDSDEQTAPSTTAGVLSAPEQVSPEQASAPTALTAETVAHAAAPTQQPPEDSKDAQLKRFAIDFAARFGTYSSDAQAENLKQLVPLMSGDLKTWAEKILAAPSTASAEKFTAVTTAALSAEIISQSSAHAVVAVSAQRAYIDGADQRLAYEIATLSLVKSGTWKVESVEWKPRPE